MRYIEVVRPKGAVPVAALEWRIKEDMTVNILAVAKAAHVAGAGPREEAGSESSEAGRPEAPASRYERQPTRAAPPPQPPFPNLLLQFNDQPTQLLKRTTNMFLPTAVYSTARQAINTINNVNTTSRRAVLSKAAESTREDGERLQEVVVGWYKCKTMTLYCTC